MTVHCCCLHTEVSIRFPLYLYIRLLIILSLFLSGEEHSGVAISRAKRSRNAYLTYDSGDCSNDNQTLTAQMEIPVSKFEESSFHAEGGEDHMSGSTEDTETDCSETDSAESDSDEDMAALSGENFALLLGCLRTNNCSCQHFITFAGISFAV